MFKSGYSIKKEASIFDIIKNVAISVFLILLIPITLYQGINTFLPKPMRPSDKAIEKLKNEEIRLKKENKKDELLHVKSQLRLARQDYKVKKEEHKKSMRCYALYYFFVALFVGLLLIIMGYFFSAEFIKIGLIIGAFIGFFYYLSAEFSQLSSTLCFFIMLGLLAGIIISMRRYIK